MAFDPTGQVGLPQDLTYSDILPTEQSGFPSDWEVVVAYNPAAPTYFGRGYMRGFHSKKRWSPTSYYLKDTTTGGWHPYATGHPGNAVPNGYSSYHILPKYCGLYDGFWVTFYAPASLKDGVTAYGYYFHPDMIGIGGSPTVAEGFYTTFRYDTGLPGETGGVWRYSNWAKTYSYDFLTHEESGFMYDVCVPYVRDTLAVGTTATGYAFCAPWADNLLFKVDTLRSDTLQSTGVTYTCIQVEPTHKWQRG